MVIQHFYDPATYTLTYVVFDAATRDAVVIDPVLAWATFLGGSGLDLITDVALDAQGNAYVCGTTSSIDYPVLAPLQPGRNGNTDAFVAKLAEKARGIKVGNGFEAGVNQGPLIDAQGLAKVEEHVADAVAKGAKVAARELGVVGLALHAAHGPHLQHEREHAKKLPRIA